MPYVVKVTAYLDQNGFPVSSINHAHHYETETLAETAAYVADGIVAEVKQVIKPARKAKPVKAKAVQRKTKSATKANQSWMTGGK